MPRSKSTCQIIEEVRMLERARLVCAMLREEKILSHSPYIVLHLAQRLLKSLG